MQGRLILKLKARNNWHWVLVTIQEYYKLWLVGSDLTVFIITLAVAVIEQKHEIRLSLTFFDVSGMSAIVCANGTAMIHTAISIDRWVSVRFPIIYCSFQGPG